MEPRSPDVDERERSSSLGRGLAVLGALLDAPFGSTLAGVAHRTGLSRAAARRFLLTLCDEGLARQSGRHFLPSLAVRTLARTAVADPAFWALFDDDMGELSATIGESCSLATLDGTEIEYVARCQGPRVLSVSLGVGSRFFFFFCPASQTSMGRVLLASLPERRREALVRGASHEARTGRSLVDPERILVAIRAARELGYAALDQELEDRAGIGRGAAAGAFRGVPGGAQRELDALAAARRPAGARCRAPAGRCLERDDLAARRIPLARGLSRRRRALDTRAQRGPPRGGRRRARAGRPRRRAGSGLPPPRAWSRGWRPAHTAPPRRVPSRSDRRCWSRRRTR